MNPILWPKYYFTAALSYLTDRSEKPAIIVDNSVLHDGVLSTREKVSGHDCIICIANEFVTNFQINDDSVSFSARFNGFYHHLEIPFDAINAVYAYKSNCMINDNGEMNMFALPKVIMPPGATRRNEVIAAQRNNEFDKTKLDKIEDQPLDALDHTNLPNVAGLRGSHVDSFKVADRRKGDRRS